jgi:hypothetical protein
MYLLKNVIRSKRDVKCFVIRYGQAELKDVNNLTRKSNNWPAY